MVLMEHDSTKGTISDLLADLDLPRVPQQARSRQKRDALLMAAVRLFAEHGYDNTTADDIAAEAGVSIGTFYSYFRNKRQLFLTMFADKVDALMSLRISEAEFGDDPRQIIRQLLHQAMQHDHMFYRLRRVWCEILPRDPEIAAYQQRVNQFIYEQIKVVAQRAIAAGIGRADLDVESTCWALTLLLHQGWISLPSPDEAPPEQIKRHHDALADIVYHALFRGQSSS